MIRITTSGSGTCRTRDKILNVALHKKKMACVFSSVRAFRIYNFIDYRVQIKKGAFATLQENVHTDIKLILILIPGGDLQQGLKPDLHLGMSFPVKASKVSIFLRAKNTRECGWGMV